MAAVDLTAARLRELVHYNQETGAFTRRVSLSHSVKVGDAAGSVHAVTGYASLFVDGRRYQAHRLAWFYVHGHWPADQIDHINGIRTDNRIDNLREATGGVNCQNKRRPMSTNKSGLMGVSWLPKANKWRAQVQVNGKPLYLGLFADKHDAHAEYLKAKRAVHAGCTI